MSTWSTITWDVARAGGFLAYGLIVLSVALGLVLSLRWRSKTWPRWATNDLHKYITLLALVFTGIHTLAVWLDPFMAFGPGEVFVPMLSHYRPLWVALGIVSSYLLLAIWFSERLQRIIGYAWWRRLHYLTFAIYCLATVHGITTGTDTRTSWAVGIYIAGSVLIGSLLIVRLLLPGRTGSRHPRLAMASAALVGAAVIWTISGPLRPGWNVVANNGNGSGARVALQVSHASAASGLAVPFSADLQGSVTQSNNGGELSGDGSTDVQVTATLNGGVRGQLLIALHGHASDDGSLAIDQGQVRFQPSNAAIYTGTLVSFSGGRMVAVCRDPNNDQVRLDIMLQADSSGNVSGTVQGSAA